MFGRDRQSNQQYNQLPYEVYETVHEPEIRRRRLVVRLVVSLLVVTALILGGVSLQRALSGKDDKKQAQTSQASSGGNQSSDTQNTVKPTDAVVQSPQQNTPLPTSGSNNSIPANTTENDSTVRKPE